MQIFEVQTRRERKEFLDFPKRLYRDDPFWVCPLDSEIEGIFDPSRNHTFRNGFAARWILADQKGKTIGRVAAFIDKKRSATQRQPTGGMGFFEVTESREAAFMLFDIAKKWLADRSMEAMDGPVNFGENDNFWGLLVEGFMPQGYAMPYNKRYYRDYFEAYGFKNYFNQFSYHREVRNDKGDFTTFPGRLWKVAEWVAKKPGYSFRHFEFKNARKYIDDICEVYNTTWAFHKEDFTPIDPDILEGSIKKARMIIDEETIIFMYHNGRIIGFYAMLPDLNQILRHLNGKLGPAGIIKFLYYKMTHEMTRLRASVGGVIHTYHNRGIEAALFYEFYRVFKNKPWIRELEFSWIGEYNSRMLATTEALGGVRVKTHVTYRYLINDKIPFRRYEDEMIDNLHLRNKEKAGMQ